MKITINKWDAFQPRKDRSNHTWFRVDNTIIFSESLEGLSADQKWFWICLLAYAQRKDSATLEYNAAYFEKHFGLSSQKMLAALRHFAANGTITLESDNHQTPADTAKTPSDTCSLATDRQTDKHTNRQPAEPEHEFDFESVYAEYPRKEGKAEGIKRLRGRIKTPEEFENFRRAVRGYAALCRKENRDVKYTKHWSSFIGTDDKEPWRDYLTMMKPPPVAKPEAELAREPDVRGDPERTMQVKELIQQALGYHPKREGA